MATQLTEDKGVDEGGVNEDKEPTMEDNVTKVKMFRCKKCCALVPQNQKLALLHLKLSHKFNLKTRLFEGDEIQVTEQPEQQITEVNENTNPPEAPPPAKKKKKTAKSSAEKAILQSTSPPKNISKENITKEQMSPLIINVRSIKVHCNFCKAEFQDSSNLLKHVQQVHKLACSLKECNPLIIGGRPVVIQVKLPQELQPSTPKATEVITLDSEKNLPPPIIPTANNLKTNEVITLSDSDDDDIKLEPIEPNELNEIPVPIEPESNAVTLPTVETEQEGTSSEPEKDLPVFCRPRRGQQNFIDDL